VAVWGDFEVDLSRVIGRGGMSTVYEGRQVSLNRPVAIKVLKADLAKEDKDFVDRFHREAQVIARLIDPRIVQVFGAGEVDGQFFYAMERIEGEDLQKKIRAGEPFSENEVLRVAENVAAALDIAWKRKIVHRDIKPSNIIITPDGQVKVMDFGLAKHLEGNVEMSSVVMGTPKYMSPEQATAQPCDVRSDLYSLGVVLYELAVGKAPFEADDFQALMYKQIYEDAPPPRRFRPELSEPFEMMILRLMNKFPDKRYQDPRELIQEIERIRSRQKVAGRTVSVVRRAAEARVRATQPRSNRVAALAAALLILSGVAVGVNWNALRERLGIAPPPRPPDTGGQPPLPPPPTSRHTGDDLFVDLYRKAMDAYSRGEWGEARRSLEAALSELPPDDPRRENVQKHYAKAWSEDTQAQAEAADRVEDYSKAGQLWRELYERDGSESAMKRMIESLFRQGIQEAYQMELDGQWKLALRRYESLRADAPDPSLVQNRIEFCSTVLAGVHAFEAGDYRKAKDHLAKALSYGRMESAVRPLWEEAEKRLSQRMREDVERRLGEMQLARQRAFDLAAAGRWEEAMKELEVAAPLAEKDSALQEKLSEVRQALAAPKGMVFVPAGAFDQGMDDGPAEWGPRHKSATSAFYIDAREVSRREYADFLARFTDHSRCHEHEPPNKDHTPLFWNPGADPDSPVTGVDWFDAYAYAASVGKRLPTEAEFEKAAAFDGVTAKSRTYPWGNHYRSDGGVSPWGADGMGGGPQEWTSGLFAPYPDSRASSPLFGKRFRVVKGGVSSREEEKSQARCAARHPVEPTNRRTTLGFRCVKDPR
jgi:formylglycine-generating enzyme required for sulfatase activity/predicted Ser/Thr protein kinase